MYCLKSKAYLCTLNSLDPNVLYIIQPKHQQLFLYLLWQIQIMHAILTKWTLKLPCNLHIQNDKLRAGKRDRKNNRGSLSLKYLIRIYFSCPSLVAFFQKIRNVNDLKNSLKKCQVKCFSLLEETNSINRYNFVIWFLTWQAICC